MNNLDEISTRLQRVLDEKDEVREIAIKSTRAIIRLAGTIIHSTHKGEDAEELMRDAINETDDLRSLLKEHPDIWYSGLVGDALQELAEAAIFLAIVNKRDLPTPEDLGIWAVPYLMGFADAIGEIRRLVLTHLRNGDIERAAEYLDLMEDMFLILMRFDYPHALVAVRRKQDVARSLLERTRGDVALAVSSRRLESRIEELYRRLEESNTCED